MMTNRLFLILSFCLSFSTGCVSFNTPFIDVDETLQLEEGLSIQETKARLGAPLVVQSGNNSSNEVIWIYEVRTIEVQSGKSSKGDIIPNKTHGIIQHDKPIHRLSITFVGGKVTSWGATVKELVENDNDSEKDKDDKDSTRNEETNGNAESENHSKKSKVFNHSLQGIFNMGKYENATFGLRYEKRIKKDLWIGGQAGMHDWGSGIWLGFYAIKPLMKKRFFTFHQLVGLSNWGRYLEGFYEDEWDYSDSDYQDSWGLMLEERLQFSTPMSGLNIDLHAGLVTGEFGGGYVGSGIAYSF